MRTIAWSAILVGVLTFAASSRADRSGNFDIMVQPVTKESSQVMNRDAYFTSKEKSQSLIYKVRIDLKGIEKLEGLKVVYVVCYRSGNMGYSSSGNQSSLRYVQGEEDIAKMAPSDRREFTTREVENTYHETQWDSGRSQYGKAQLRGIALRIMRGDAILAEIANPPEMKDAWKKSAEVHSNGQYPQRRDGTD